MKKTASLFIALMVMVSITLSCKHTPEEILGTGNPPVTEPPTGGEQTCSADTVYFQNKILPLLISSCAKSNCHDAISHQEGIQLTSYQTIINTGDIRAFDLNHGDIWELINETDPNRRMPPPPSDPLTSAEKDLIRRWILQGAKNNACNDCDSSIITYSAAVAPMINTNCKGCHNPSFQSGGLDLTTFNSVKSIALNGKLMGVINHAAGFSAMPKGAAKLSDCKIAQVRQWVEQGSQNN